MRDNRAAPAQSVADLVKRDQAFSHNAAGDPIERDRTCECGRVFTQRLLSERFMAMAEKHSPRAAQLIMQQIPDLFVPVHCPHCERVELGRQARIDGARFETRNYTLRMETEHAAD